MSDALSTGEDVAIVVTVRDRPSLFPACLEALYAHTDLPFQAIAVVGGAGAETRRYLDRVAARRGNLRVIHRDAPLSLGQARRLAIGQLRGRRCVFLENDTIVHAGWLAPLVRCAREQRAAVVAPLILWHRGVHAAGGRFERIRRDGAVVLRHAIEYRDVRCKRIDYAETHCILVDLAQVAADDLCDPAEPSDVDLGLSLESHGCTTLLEPRSVVTYAAPPPLAVGDIAHSLQRWSLDAWRAGHARFLARWGVVYDAAAKHASYRRQELRLALVRRYPTAAAVAITNLGTQLLNGVTTCLTSGRARRSFG
jgi:glycosyltransferase involved in cell wall biosynthesis